MFQYLELLLENSGFLRPAFRWNRIPLIFLKENEKIIDRINKPTEQPRLMHIYLAFGRPKLIYGYPSAIALTMWMRYDDAGLQSLRILRFVKPTEVTRYKGQTKTNVTI